MARLDYIFVVLAAVSLTACAGRFPLVGLDAKGNPVLAYVNERKYMEHAAEALETVRETVAPELAKHSTTSAWEPSSVSVGFSVRAEGGLGPFQAGIRPGIRAVFARGDLDPPPPAEGRKPAAAHWDNNEEPNMTGDMHRIVRMHAKLFDRLDQRPVAGKDWRLDGCSVDLALSAQGVLGLLVARGEAAAGLYWKRKTALAHSLPGDDRVDAFFSADHPQDLTTALEPVIRAVSSSGEVLDLPAFRRNLTSLVNHYHLLFRYVTWHPGLSWKISRLRLDIGVDISGKVSPAARLGTGVRLRFEWIAPRRDLSYVHHRDSTTETLQRLLDTISKELDTISLEEAPLADFPLKFIRFGLGVSASGQIGIARASASVAASVVFSRVTGPVAPILLPSPVTEESITLIDEATGRGIPEVNFLAKPDFRKGLDRAIRIGSLLAEQAAQLESKSWEVSQISAGFSLSLSGSSGLVTIGGNAAVGLTFERS